MITSDDIQKACRTRDAVWHFNYDGDPTEPHIQLTSGGMHTDGYYKMERVTSDPACLVSFADEIVQRYENTGKPRPDWVVGPSYGGITFSYELAGRFEARHGYTRKDPDRPGRILWQDFEIPEGAKVLLADDVVTTFGTAFTMREAIESQNPHKVEILSTIVTIIYRPRVLGVTLPLDVIALAEREVKSWHPETCLLCKGGSQALRPEGENWQRLMRPT